MAADPIPWTHVYSGKVRDLYADDGRLLFVASDRISAYDWVLPTPIPDKGRILTAMSLWWFERLAGIVDNHVISTDVPQQVAGRAVVCERLQMLPVECVVRGLPQWFGVGRLSGRWRRVRRQTARRPAGVAAASRADLHPATKRRSAITTRTSTSAQWWIWSAKMSPSGFAIFRCRSHVCARGRSQQRLILADTSSSSGFAVTAESCWPTRC